MQDAKQDNTLLYLYLAATVATLAALGAVFFYAPVEATMGIVQKIFYFHVASAIAAYCGFAVCCGGSTWYLLKDDVRADVVARAGAEIGVVFCLFVLVSGPLWARKAWGTFWTGEPRLMLTLVMCLIYVSYLVVRSFGGSGEMTRKIGAALALLGFVDIPFVRYSVARWRGNHPRVLNNGGISPDMQKTLTLAFVAVALLFAAFLMHRIRIGLLEEKADKLGREVAGRNLLLDERSRTMGVASR